MADIHINKLAVEYQGLLQTSNVSYLPPPDSEPLSPVFLDPALSGTNLKSKSKNIIKLFRTHSNYQQPRVLKANDDFEEKETEKISDNEIEINSSDNKNNIEMKKVGVWKPTKKHHSPNKNGVALQLKKAVQISQA